MAGWLPGRRDRWFIDVGEPRAVQPASSTPVVEHIGQVVRGGQVSVRVHLPGADPALVDDVSWTTQEWLAGLTARLDSVLGVRAVIDVRETTVADG